MKRTLANTEHSIASEAAVDRSRSDMCCTYAIITKPRQITDKKKD